MKLDIDAARAARPYTRKEYAGARPVDARPVPVPLQPAAPVRLAALPAALLRRQDRSPRPHLSQRDDRNSLECSSIGDDASIGERVLVYSLGLVEIGARATVSHNAHLCAGSHDYRSPDLPLLRLPIRIGDEAWVCAQAFVGPGSEIGNGAVVGAGAVSQRQGRAVDGGGGQSRRVRQAPRDRASRVAMISVVVLTLNEAGNLPRCLDSVSLQRRRAGAGFRQHRRHRAMARAYGARVSWSAPSTASASSATTPWSSGDLAE